jgi:IS30 family transposase
VCRNAGRTHQPAPQAGQTRQRQRKLLPKGTDLSQHSHQALAAIESFLNSRPRQNLGYRTPAEAFSELKLDQVQGIALQA